MARRDESKGGYDLHQVKLLAQGVTPVSQSGKEWGDSVCGWFYRQFMGFEENDRRDSRVWKEHRVDRRRSMQRTGK